MRLSFNGPRMTAPLWLKERRNSGNSRKNRPGLSAEQMAGVLQYRALPWYVRAFKATRAKLGNARLRVKLAWRVLWQ